MRQLRGAWDVARPSPSRRGRRVTALGFVVLFVDGHEERFACPLDAHARMNSLRSGALRTVRASDGAVTGR